MKKTLVTLGVALGLLAGTLGYIYSQKKETSTAINQTNIEFYVPNSWMLENNIEKTSIKLLRFHEIWQELPTSYLRLENSNHYYSASSEGFSYFAIAGQKATAENITALEEEILAEEQANQEGNQFSIKYIIIGLSAFLFILILIIFFIWYERKKEQNL